MRKRSIALACALLIVGVASASCNRAGSSPTATFKAYYEATQKKDAEGMKKTLSKGTLEMLEGFAKLQNKSLDEALKSGLANNETPSEKMPETRNEKIEGDKATLEIQDAKSGKWESLPFVKEDGAWKIAFDQLFRNTMKSTGATGTDNSSK